MKRAPRVAPRLERLPWWKPGEGATFRLHGRRWTVVKANREARALEVESDAGERVSFRERVDWQMWAKGGWRYESKAPNA